MDANTDILIYKCACILSGMLLVFFGYRLFVLGFTASSAKMSASGKGFSLKLTDAAPGIFFSLFGAAVIGATVWKGMGIESTETFGAAASNTTGTSISEKSIPHLEHVSDVRSPEENILLLQRQLDELQEAINQVGKQQSRTHKAGAVGW